MKEIFLINGPGHHFHAIKNILEYDDYKLSYSNYWPTFNVKRYNEKEKQSIAFNLLSKGIYLSYSKFLKYFFRYPWQNEVIINLYSRQVRKYIRANEESIIWSFQMAAKHVFADPKFVRCRKILEYSMIHIDSYMQIMENEYSKYRYHGYKNSYFSPSLVNKIKEEFLLADKINVLSSFAKRTMVDNGVDENKINVIPLSVDSDYFKPSLSDQEARVVYNKKLKLLFVGRLEYLKGLQYLLQAVNKFRDSVELCLVGDVSDESKFILSPYKSNKNIILLGKKNKSELLKLYQSFDVLVLPSIQESFGWVILEAMSSGMTVIGSKNSGAPDIISEGIDGFIIPPYDAKAIIERIEELLVNPKLLQAMKVKAREKIISKYTISHYADRINNIVLKN